jgi:hypothetical protein
MLALQFLDTTDVLMSSRKLKQTKLVESMITLQLITR